MSTLYALIFIYLTVTVFVVSNRPHRTGLLTRSFQMHYGVVRTSIGTHSTFLTLGWIYVHVGVTRCDGTELTGVKTSLSHAESAVICY